MGELKRIEREELMAAIVYLATGKRYTAEQVKQIRKARELELAERREHEFSFIGREGTGKHP